MCQPSSQPARPCQPGAPRPVACRRARADILPTCGVQWRARGPEPHRPDLPLDWPLYIVAGRARRASVREVEARLGVGREEGAWDTGARPAPGKVGPQ